MNHFGNWIKCGCYGYERMKLHIKDYIQISYVFKLFMNYIVS